MSANSANPVEKVDDTDAPIQDKGVDYERYAADDSSKKTANAEMVFDSAEIDKSEKT